MDDTQNPAAAGSDAAQDAPAAAQNGQQAATESQGTTTLDLTKSDVGSTNEAVGTGSQPVSGETKPTLDEALAADALAAQGTQTDAEKGAAIVDAQLNSATTAPAITPIQAAGAHGVLSKLESEFETMYAEGQSAFKTWFKSVVAELKEHLKV